MVPCMHVVHEQRFSRFSIFKSIPENMQFSFLFLTDPPESNLAQNTKKHGFFWDSKIRDEKYPF